MNVTRVPGYLGREDEIRGILSTQTIDQAARALKVSRGTVSFWKKRMGLSKVVVPPVRDPNLGSRVCTKCKAEKPAIEFHPSKNTRLKCVSRCALCTREDRRLAYIKKVGYDPQTVDRRKLREFRGSRGMPLTERLAAQSVEIPATGCRLMTKVPATNGYVQIRYEGKLLLAHVVVFKLSGRTLGPGQEIDHLCNNPKCINPLHLEAVTRSENAKRSYQRGRKPSVGPRLTEEQVRELRALYEAGGTTQGQLATLFKVSRSTVNGILCRRRRAMVA
jgi:hypothetical protein